MINIKFCRGCKKGFDFGINYEMCSGCRLNLNNRIREVKEQNVL